MIQKLSDHDREKLQESLATSGQKVTPQREIVFAVLLLSALPASAQDFPKLTGRVVDDAHVLSPEQVAQLNQISADIEQASTRQFVVVTAH